MPDTEEILYGHAGPRNKSPFNATSGWLIQLMSTRCYFENWQGFSGSDYWMVKSKSLPEIIKTSSKGQRPAYQMEKQLSEIFIDPPELIPCQLIESDAVSKEDALAMSQRKMLQIEFTAPNQGDKWHQDHEDIIVWAEAAQIVEGLCGPGAWAAVSELDLAYLVDGNVKGYLLTEWVD